MNRNVNVKKDIGLFYDGLNGIVIVDVTIMAIILPSAHQAQSILPRARWWRRTMDKNICRPLLLKSSLCGKDSNDLERRYTRSFLSKELAFHEMRASRHEVVDYL